VPTRSLRGLALRRESEGDAIWMEPRLGLELCSAFEHLPYHRNITLRKAMITRSLHYTPTWNS
jgi:hypothetical protein